MRLYLLAPSLLNRFLVIKFITVIIALLSQAALASPPAQTFSTNICGYTLSFIDSLTEEIKDTIEVAKIIAFMRENKNNSTEENITILPIDILLASMTIVVETDNHTHTVKADLTTGAIFNNLKSLKEGSLLLDVQNELWEELNDPIKEKLKPSGLQDGYILTLDGNSTNSFDNIVLRNATFDQASIDLLQQAKIESNGNGHIDPKYLLLAMMQSNDLHFIYELVTRLGLFDRNQRQSDEIRSVINNNTSTIHRYTSILQLQLLHHTSRQNNGNGTQQLNIDVYLLSKFGFFRRAVGQLISLIESNDFDELRIEIKRHILGNTSSEEVEEVNRLSNTDIEILVNENDIRRFLKDHSFTNEEIELFIKKFIQTRESTQSENTTSANGTSTRSALTTPMPQQRQQLIDRLRDMDQNELEVFIRGIGFEMNNDFINHLMDPRKVPRNTRQLFFKFIANVEQAGSISNIRTSNNTYGFKKIRAHNIRSQTNQRLHYYSLHLGKGDWVVVLIKEGDIFVLDQIMSHNAYSRHF